jgi:hypothetical protein
MAAFRQLALSAPVGVHHVDVGELAARPALVSGEEIFCPGVLTALTPRALANKTKEDESAARSSI